MSESAMALRADGELLGRDAILERVAAMLRSGQNVMLYGPQDIGKSAVIAALAPRDVVVIDPFERVHSHLAARVRRAIDRRAVYLVAARSPNRRELGAVRRIISWFTTVRVTPLSAYWMRRLLRREWRRAGLPADLLSTPWSRGALRLSRGRPGMAIAMVHVAASARAQGRSILSPDAAYIEARIGKARLLTRELR